MQNREITKENYLKLLKDNTTIPNLKYADNNYTIDATYRELRDPAGPVILFVFTLYKINNLTGLGELVLKIPPVTFTHKFVIKIDSTEEDYLKAYQRFLDKLYEIDFSKYYYEHGSLNGMNNYASRVRGGDWNEKLEDYKSSNYPGNSMIEERILKNMFGGVEGIETDTKQLSLLQWLNNEEVIEEEKLSNKEEALKNYLNNEDINEIVNLKDTIVYLAQRVIKLEKKLKNK